MTEATGKLRYHGGFLGMRELSVYLREQGLEVAVETSEEHRDAVATIEAIITFASVPGTVVGLAELAKRARRAIGKFRNESQDRRRDRDHRTRGREPGRRRFPALAEN